MKPPNRAAGNEAINRQFTYYANHVGQVVFLARHFAGPARRSLSISRGKSREFDVAKDGSRYAGGPTGTKDSSA